jgi:hypothetical protein
MAMAVNVETTLYAINKDKTIVFTVYDEYIYMTILDNKTWPGNFDLNPKQMIRELFKGKRLMRVGI